MDSRYHIYPVNDIKEHTMNSHCLCKPLIHVSKEGVFTVHNSFDHREQKEELIRNIYLN